MSLDLFVREKKKGGKASSLINCWIKTPENKVIFFVWPYNKRVDNVWNQHILNQHTTSKDTGSPSLYNTLPPNVAPSYLLQGLPAIMPSICLTPHNSANLLIQLVYLHSNRCNAIINPGKALFTGEQFVYILDWVEVPPVQGVGTRKYL